MKSSLVYLTSVIALLASSVVWSETLGQNGVLHEGEVSLLKVDIDPAKIKDPAGAQIRIFNLRFPVFAAKDGGHYVLISAPLGVAKGIFVAEVMDGEVAQKSFDIKVESRDNTSTEEILDAPEANVLPQDVQTISRISREDAEQKALFMVRTPARFWSTPFVKPVDFPITSRFGLYRLYSSHMRRRTHWGVDFKTPVGTPVRASGDGVVVLARELYFPGKTVIIDHGNGLYTGYSHLESMKVKVGQKVEAGKKIGRSGRSGKITGAHLHWFGVNSRVKFDPLKLLDVQLDESKFKKE